MRRLPVFLCVALGLSACGGGAGGTTSGLPATASGGGTQTNGDAPTTTTPVPAAFNVVDLGVHAAPLAINNRNSVAGQFSTNASSVAFIYRNGTFTKFRAAFSAAVAINDSDLAVGGSYAFMPNGTEIPLGTTNSALVSEAFGVDDSGRIAGVLIQGGVAGCSGALTFWSTSGAPSEIGNQTDTLVVSRNGKVVLDGYQQTGNGCNGILSPYYYPSGTPVPIPPGLTLGVGPAVNPGAITGVNDAGDVVGYGEITGTNDLATFLARNGKAIQINAPAGYTQLQGAAINDVDWIVGTESGTTSHAFLWSNGTIIDLNTRLTASCAAWTLNSATGINDAGYIVGLGTLNGKTHGYMLVPSQ